MVVINVYDYSQCLTTPLNNFKDKIFQNYHFFIVFFYLPTVCKILKQQWNSLDLSDLKLPEITQVFQKDVADLLAFIDRRLEPDMVALLPRGDYKEFLELAKFILGGSIDRKKGYIYTIQVPGADHHARWMSKSIYTLKLRLLLHQFSQYDIHWQTRKKVRYSRQYYI